jgi:hypothetical protein
MIDDSFTDPDFERGIGSSSLYSVEGPCQENDAGACDHWRTDSGEDKNTRIPHHSGLGAKAGLSCPQTGTPKLANVEAYARDSWKLPLTSKSSTKGAIIGGWKCPGSGMEAPWSVIEKLRPVRRGGQGIPTISAKDREVDSLADHWLLVLASGKSVSAEHPAVLCFEFRWGPSLLSTSPTLSLSNPSCFFSVLDKGFFQLISTLHLNFSFTTFQQRKNSLTAPYSLAPWK